MTEKKIEIRKEIMEFAEEMERIMNKHDINKSDSWKTCDEGFLWKKLREEWKELDDCYSDESKSKEFIDVANVCMMLWNRLK